MRGLLIFSVLSLSGLLSVPSWADEVEGEDPFFGPDKALHFSVSAALGSGSFALLDALSAEDEGWQHASLAMSAVLTVGLAKELYDEAWGSGFSSRDLFWDVAGGVFAVGLSWLVWELCHDG